jgi:hypothetical protein
MPSEAYLMLRSAQSGAARSTHDARCSRCQCSWDLLPGAKDRLRVTCGRPEVKGVNLQVNSIYNGWRMEEVWLDK